MLNQIRNFVIISHIDHGKSTLADRLIELTGTVPKEKIKPQMLDSMELERERGITIKMAPVRMLWHGYILNLIDTPGHVDFTYEVSRALSCVEGAVLLVDATKGIQAQTLSNFRLAQAAGLTIIPAINKIDLPSADIASAQAALQALTGRVPLKISAKTGEGVTELIDRIIHDIPAPTDDEHNAFKALVFDSLYDEHRGVIVYVRVFDGGLAKGATLNFMATGATARVLEVGYFHPERRGALALAQGEIGYVVTDLKSLTEARVGDTVAEIQNTEPIAGFREPKPMVYASVFPVSSADTPLLRKALDKLRLNDAAFQFEPAESKAFGPGFKLGCLGLLHLDIVKQRLEREFGLELVVTTPQVAYRKKSQISNLKSQNDWEEPFVRLEIVTPPDYLGSILELINRHRGMVLTNNTISESLVIEGEAPLGEIIIDFYDELKSVSSGYATMDYELIDYRESDLVPLDVLVAEEKMEPFSQLIHGSKVNSIARRLVTRLKELIPRQNFEIKIQAAVGSKIIASERISPLRKDVTAKLYGGDVTRKNKLLDKQKKGKKRMRQFGRVEIPTDVFLNVLKRS
ncbi:MAG: translation elongation factor 4 [Patescibacteria group bacterium]